MSEPPRQGETPSGSNAFSLAEIGRYVRERWQAYGALIGGVSLLAILGYGTMAWYPEFLVRNHGMSAAV